jgi:hypothetical protein
MTYFLEEYKEYMLNINIYLLFKSEHIPVTNVEHVEVIPIINHFLFLVIVAIFDGRQAYGT